MNTSQAFFKNVFCLLYGSAASLFSLAQLNEPYTNYPEYAGNDLGVSYSSKSTVFKVWSPVADAVKLRLYKSGDGGSAFDSVNLVEAQAGVWQIAVHKDLKNSYYTFQVKEEGRWLEESPDIYAKAVGVNGKRGMIVSKPETDPPGWNKDVRPPLKSFTDIIIYESHIRDISISPTSGIRHKGLFPGLTERGTKGPGGVATGLDHLKELGITHIHLLPSFDFNSIDETGPRQHQYNWGYDPLNYNVPEGSYSTDPYNGKTRIKEFKQMVQALHANGIRVILDVVYNHTSDLKTPFNQFAPGYFYRHTADGKYTNATACGNETASEKAMMRRFMIASVVYWVKEYHIDGFRFDLMGVHDMVTMNAISDTLHKIDPTVFIYGEGWTAGASPLPEEERAVKKNTFKLHRIAAFSDDIRDGLRGPFSNTKLPGFVSGGKDNAESVKFGIVAATRHPQINYGLVAYSQAPWAAEPYQSINYVSCHDDPTLFDRLAEANAGATEEDLIKMDKLAQTVVLTSQGVPFVHSGAEMLRTKRGVHNSYDAPDSINEIDWSRKVKYANLFNYYKQLIALRKAHPAFRLSSTKDIQSHLNFIDTADPLLIAYRLSGVKEDRWQNILVLLNGNTAAAKTELPKGRWQLAGDGNMIGEKSIKELSGIIVIPAATAYILYQ